MNDVTLWRQEGELAIQAVLNINQEIYDDNTHIGLEYIDLLEYRTDGYAERIDFLGQQIWSSEDEGERGYNRKLEEHEPLESFLRRAVNKLVGKIGEISLGE